MNESYKEALVDLNCLLKGAPMNREEATTVIDNVLLHQGITPTPAARAGAALGLMWEIGKKYLLLLAAAALGVWVFMAW